MPPAMGGTPGGNGKSSPAGMRGKRDMPRRKSPMWEITEASTNMGPQSDFQVDGCTMKWDKVPYK